jgi:hypothetical protein
MGGRERDSFLAGSTALEIHDAALFVFSSCVPDVFLTGILWPTCVTEINPI